MGWHHEECDGNCLACLIEALVKENYGEQGLDFLRRKVGVYNRDLSDASVSGVENSGEPVAWMCSDERLCNLGYSRFSNSCAGEWNIPVYTANQLAAAILRERDANAMDAARYRWLKENKFRHNGHCFYYVSPNENGGEVLYGKELDEAIDAILAKREVK